MFDISWHELFLVALVTVIVVGPKEIPRVLKTVTGAMRKIRGMARDFQNSIDELAREAELDDLKKSVQGAGSLDLSKEVENVIDPGGSTEASIKELKTAVETGPSEGEGDGAAKPEEAITPESISEAYRNASTPSDSLTPPQETPPRTEPAEEPARQEDTQAPVEGRSAASRS